MQGRRKRYRDMIRNSEVLYCLVAADESSIYVDPILSSSTTPLIFSVSRQHCSVLGMQVIPLAPWRMSVSKLELGGGGSFTRLTCVT